MRAFSIHRGPEMSEARKRCIAHNSNIVDLTLVGDEYQKEVESTGICVVGFPAYSEVLRLLLLSKEPNLLYLDTDCWLVEPPSFHGPGRSRKSNWAMFSGNEPGLFDVILSQHKARKKVNEAVDHKLLCMAGAQVINAIHKWEIPWFKE